MKRSASRAAFAALLLIGALDARADEPTGPVIELPPNDPPPTPVRIADPTLAKDRSYAMDLGAGRRIPIGSYGETMVLVNPNETQARLRRLVLFFGHHFNEWASVYSELEVEDLSRFEIEQSYLELSPIKGDKLKFRVGLVLVPLGIVNLYHEPPTFNGVDRPAVDQLILPTTWRDMGAGIFGTITTGLHYQVYAVAGADGSKFTADGGIGPGISRGFNINTQNAAATGRLNYNGVPGLDVAAGFYYGSANQKDANLTGINVGIIEADARFSRWGLSLRAEYARVFITGADRITELIRQTSPTAAAIGSAQQGFYAEAGYDLLHATARTEQQVIVFGRYEYVDTRAELPQVSNPGASEALQYVTAGVTFRPRLELAFKFDYRHRLAGDDRLGGDNRFSLGVGFMY